MKENSNRAIAGNALILYVKMGINTICALLTTRFALQALGVVDYGLYSVLGSIISFISIFNTIMVSTTNRYIAVALGKGDTKEVNKQFNACLVIHVVIAIIALIVALPVGEWYIHRFVNYSGDISNASMVFTISVLGSIFSFVGVPYNGLLMAKEKFFVFSFADVISHIIRLIVAFLLLNHFEHKLLIYTVTIAAMYAMPTVVFIIYCSLKYPSYVRLKLTRDRSNYKDILGFSSWVAIGAFAVVGKNQGAALLVNAFFNTVMNAAMGIASTVNGYITMFAQNVSQPMEPQIVKSYAAGDRARTDDLLIMSTKFSYILTLLLGSFFMVSPDWLLGLWLKEVPPYASTFLVLFIVDNLIRSFNSGIKNIIFANGNIVMFQIVITIVDVLSVVFAYIILKMGNPAYSLGIVYIGMSVVRFVLVQWSLHRTLNYDNSILWRRSYLPSIVMTLLFCPCFFLPDVMHPILKILLSELYLCLLIWFVGLQKDQRTGLVRIVNNKLNILNRLHK